MLKQNLNIAAIIKTVVVASLVAAVTGSIPSISSADENNQECILSAQLRDPYIKAEYDAFIAAKGISSKSIYAEDVEGMYANIQSANFDFSGNNDPTPILDSMTFECLGCHDGITAKSIGYRIKLNEGANIANKGNVFDSHPIGTNYVRKASGDEGYKQLGELHPDMIFIDGKVGCLSCHNPLNTGKNHLIVNNDTSGLCLTCHKK